MSTERAMVPQIDQEWEVRFPTSGPTALFDRAVGIGLGQDRGFVAGERTLSSGNSVFSVVKYDLSGNVVQSRQWPPSTSTSLLRTVEKMAVRTDYLNNYSVIAVTGQVPNSSSYDVVTAVYFDHDGTSLDLELTNAAVLTVGSSDPYVHTPVDVQISADGLVVGVLASATNAGKTDYAIAAYSSESVMPIFTPKLLGASGDWDYPKALAISNGVMYVAGHSGSSQSGPFELFIAAIELNEEGTVLWTKRFAPEEMSAEAAAIAFEFDADIGQAVGPRQMGDGLVVVGRATYGSDWDMLTVSFDVADGDVLGYDTFGASGLDEGAVSAAGFLVNEQNETEEVPEGTYIYVTGTGESSSEGTNIVTMLYRNSTTSLGRRWVNGARWNNGDADDDDAAVQVIVTSTDDVNVDEGTTRALVGGWTTDGSGNKRFVTIKYDADLVTSGFQNETWSRVENTLSGTYANKSGGIAHRMLGSSPNRRLYFGLSGASDVGSGSTGSDFWTVWFKEESED